MRPGYKLTAVGEIPEEWEIKNLDKLGIFAKGNGVRKEDATSGTIACVRYGEIYTHHNEVIHVVNSFISEKVAKKSKKLKSGDILFAGSGETKEEIGKNTVFIGDGESYAGGDIIIFSPTEGCSIFWSYLFNSPLATRQKASKGQGDAVVHISITSLSTITIPCPPFSEQQAIAESLSDVDALLVSLDQLIAKKRDIKQATMKQLLTGEKRLPGFCEEWVTLTLGNYADFYTGGTPSTIIKEYWGGEIKWMSSGDLHLKRIQDVPGRITARGLDNSPAKFVPLYSVLIGLAGQGKTRGTVAINNVVLTTNQSIAAIHPFPDTIDYQYLYYNLDSRYKELREQSSGDGGRGGLNIKLLEKVGIHLPSTTSEQAAIAEVLSDMDAEIVALEQRRDKTRQIKQAMMQELLTGRIRLK